MDNVRLHVSIIVCVTLTLISKWILIILIHTQYTVHSTHITSIVHVAAFFFNVFCHFALASLSVCLIGFICIINIIGIKFHVSTMAL